MREPVRYLSPPEYARRLGVKPEKVLAWIKSGELRSVNTAAKQSSRPRWRISPESIVIFENGRAAQQPVAPRRRRRRDANVTSYF
jgi:excisionase family DNA binding protein